MAGFKVVEGAAVPQQDQTITQQQLEASQRAQAAAAAQAQQAMQILMLSLKTVGQRFIIALSSLFTAAGLASVWFLWEQVLPKPSVTQITGIAIYSVFFLSVEYVRRK